MTGNLQMGDNAIRDLNLPPNDPCSANPPDDCALNFKYFHSQRGDLLRQINEVGSKAFSKDGSDPIEDKSDMNIYDIINLPTAASNESSYAANVTLTSLPMCGFIAQLVEHRTGIAEVTGSNPVEALIFSGFFFPIA